MISLKLETRQQKSKFWLYFAPVLALLFSVILGTITFHLLGYPAFQKNTHKSKKILQNFCSSRIFILSSSFFELCFTIYLKNKTALNLAARENSSSLKNISDLQAILNDLINQTKVPESKKLAEVVQKKHCPRIKEKICS